MTVSHDVIQKLARGLEGAPRTGLASVQISLEIGANEIDWLACFPRAGGVPRTESFYWSNAAEGVRVLGLGCVRAFETAGADRFAETSRAVEAMLEGIASEGESAPAACGPLALGGLAFENEPASLDGPWGAFPPSRFVLPELLLVRRDGALWLTLLSDGERTVTASARSSLTSLFHGGAPPAPAAPPTGFERNGPNGMAAGPEYRVRSDRSHADYYAQVDSACRAIADGELEKVVLARSLHVKHDGRFDLRALLERLGRLYPSCVTFAVARPDACFLGATPERLVARDGTRVRTSAVAGSSRRGRTPAEDDALGRALREDKKEQAEHAVVVRAIAAALGPVCPDLVVPEAPHLLRLEGIQHLETPIEGQLPAGARPPSVLTLAERLHPTPAVGGAPRAAALEWIRRHEGLDRGWYAGPVGFVDRDGGGELRVALRSALACSAGPADEALLFAGGGIVADSQPGLELEETRMKLRALLAPLTEL